MKWNLQASTAPATAVNPMHPHCVEVDEFGNGRTSFDAGHWHEVKNRGVLADARDGHNHSILASGCQTGMAGPPAQGQPGCGSCNQRRK